MKASEARQFRLRLEQRLRSALAWYEGCDATEATLANVRKDIASLMEEVSKEIGPPPFVLRVSLEDQELVITAAGKKWS